MGLACRLRQRVHNVDYGPISYHKSMLGDRLNRRVYACPSALLDFSNGLKGNRLTWCVYMLRCSDASLYTGVTNDLDARLAAHNSGKGAKYTASRRPVRLVYHEPAKSRNAALRREIQIKRLSREQKLALIREAE